MFRVISRIVMTLVSVYCIACSAERTDSGAFPEFWASFRQAALEKDYEALKSYSKMPLELHGVDDALPVRKISEEKFSKVFRQILEQPVYSFKGDDLVEKPLIEILKGKTSVDKDFRMDAGEVRVENFVFDKVGKDWKLIRAYLE
jgi:hypothetical protein